MLFEELEKKFEGLIDILDLPPAGPGEIVAVGTVVYEAMKRDALQSVFSMCANMGRQMDKGNLWFLRPHNDRLTFPFSHYWVIKAMVAQEKLYGRRADWLLWLDDDLVVPPDTYDILRAAADPMERPLVAAMARTRYAPFLPGVTELDANGREFQWRASPYEGCHPARTVPFCITLFHRSLFDRVPQPWFDVSTPILEENHVTGPDRWFCLQMEKVGIVPYVSCDINVKHLMAPRGIGNDGVVKGVGRK